MNTKGVLFAVFMVIISLSAYLVLRRIPAKNLTSTTLTPVPTAQLTPLPTDIPATPTLLPSVTPTPTPRPISFADLNQTYGPCVQLPVLMYHHIQPEAVAKANGQAALTVDTQHFQSQLEYLKTHNYHPISPQDLNNFFANRVPLPVKPVMLTFDDGYADFGTDAAPLLQQYGFKGTLFVPTGLMDNPGYLSWETIKNIASSGLITFANHTWSHHSLKDSLPVIQKEVSLAQTQLQDHGFTERVFAYPYGTIGQTVINYLSSNNYEMAFTTRHGSIECQGQRFELPRIRIGNASLSSYGL
ncbi:polysaccharide deacetylase family protein [Patescibacteria group bacterium]|nr:polysaccharide deacetylase family protein [Patescibacteria group bacterium]